MEKIETMEQFWLCADKMKEGFFFAMLTDEILWERWPLSLEEREIFRGKERKLLDMRLFNKEKELRMFRGDIGREFQGRSLDDEKEVPDPQAYFDEEQYLDIDSKHSKVSATGGGRYHLPLVGFEDVKVMLRNYLGYYESGQAYVRDWRLMDLFQERGCRK